MSVDEWMQDVRCLAFDFFRSRLLIICGDPFGIAEDALFVVDQVLCCIGKRIVSDLQVRPIGIGSIFGDFNAVKDGTGCRRRHVGLIGMPIEFARTETAERGTRRIAQIRDSRDFGMLP